MFTRKIDNQDERAGFVTDWVLELAKNLDKLIVICQEKGDIVSLPDNVEIYSLGKEKGYNKLYQISKLQFLISKNIKKVDGVFSHMIPHYSVLIGPWCKIFKKKLIQWYVHKSVNVWLKLANIFVDEFVTASSESFRMKTKKPVHILGHGINVNKFRNLPAVAKFESRDKSQFNKRKGRFNNLNYLAEAGKQFIILSVSRISPSKNIDLLIKAIELIQLNEPDLRNKVLVQIIGGPGLKSQERYYLDLIKEIKEKDLNSVIDFIGPLPQNQVLAYYQKCDLFINLSDTGSIDKAVLEAMACEKLVLTSNEAFKNILPKKLFLSEKNPYNLVKKIKELYNLSENERLEFGKRLRREVIENHNLEKLVKKIVKLFYF